MTTHRMPDVQAAYDAHRLAHVGGCEFCAMTQNGSEHIIERFDGMLVIRNSYPYAVWDSCQVSEHLMIIPAAHHTSLADFSAEEAQEYLQLITRYEKTGYSIYSRTTLNKSRTMVHQHTHCIKLAE